MSHFFHLDGVLHADSIALPAIAAQFGTPTYVYSKAALSANFAAFADACAGRDALVCYAMKANSNLAILDLLARQGAGVAVIDFDHGMQRAGAHHAQALVQGLAEAAELHIVAVTQRQHRVLHVRQFLRRCLQQAAEAASQRWKPWRSYAVVRAWASLAKAPDTAQMGILPITPKP